MDISALAEPLRVSVLAAGSLRCLVTNKGNYTKKVYVHQGDVDLVLQLIRHEYLRPGGLQSGPTGQVDVDIQEWLDIPTQRWCLRTPGSANIARSAVVPTKSKDGLVLSPEAWEIVSQRVLKEFKAQHELSPK